MNINTVNAQSLNKVQNLSTIESGLKVDKKVAEDNGNMINGSQNHISLTGKVTSYLANLPETQQQEIKSYLQSTLEAKANGNFDIESSINDAPDAFNDLVNKFNLHDEDRLDIISDGVKGSIASSPTPSKLSGASVYADIAENTKESSSIFDKFTSLFSSDSTA